MKKKNPQKTKLPLYKSATFDYNVLTFQFQFWHEARMWAAELKVKNSAAKKEDSVKEKWEYFNQM